MKKKLKCEGQQFHQYK